MNKKAVNAINMDMDDLHLRIDSIIWSISSIADTRLRHKHDCKHAAGIKSSIDIFESMLIRNTDTFTSSISEIATELTGGGCDLATAAKHMAVCSLEKEKDDMKARQCALSSLILAASDISNAIKSEYLGLLVDEDKENQ